MPDRAPGRYRLAALTLENPSNTEKGRTLSEFALMPADGTTPSGDAATSIDPDTGQVIGGGTAANGSNSSGASVVPVAVDFADSRRQVVLGACAVGLLIGLVLGLPLVARTMRIRAGSREGTRA